jgi:hypothetical protein
VARGGARLCETRILWHGRAHFALCGGPHNRCLILELPLNEFAVGAWRHLRTPCQKGAIRPSVKIPRAVLQAVSQKRHATRTRIGKRSALVDHSVLSAEFAEGKRDPLTSPANPIGDTQLADNPLPKSERISSGDIWNLDVWSLTTPRSLLTSKSHQLQSSIGTQYPTSATVKALSWNTAYRMRFGPGLEWGYRMLRKRLDWGSDEPCRVRQFQLHTIGGV